MPLLRYSADDELERAPGLHTSRARWMRRLFSLSRYLLGGGRAVVRGADCFVFSVFPPPPPANAITIATEMYPQQPYVSSVCVRYAFTVLRVRVLTLPTATYVCFVLALHPQRSTIDHLCWCTPAALAAGRIPRTHHTRPSTMPSPANNPHHR